MKPDNPERNHALAAEYVLGTLHGAARKRFERWMMVSPKLRRQVWLWERRLQPFNESAPSMQPPADAWDALERRLFSAPETAPEPHASAAAWWQSALPWRWTTGIAVAGLMALLIWTPVPPKAPENALVGVVQGTQAQPLWVLNASRGDHSLTLRSLPPTLPASDDQDYELWLLPESGVPISLSVLPTEGAELRITLNHEQVKQLLQSRSLAISLEPHGGSPTGQPTGPVVYQTQLVDL